MASRFAQNCTACHSPGRVNVPEVKNKRCSFSCKSCHTNPNGGGLRNYYGKWNEERWLRSLFFADYKLNKPHPAPASQQPYDEKKLKNYLSTVKDPKDIERIENEGPHLAEVPDGLPESDYDRHANASPTVDDPKEAKLRIPQVDPYRVTQQNYFNGGADFRWFYLDSKTDTVEKKGMVPMATDVGASVKPMKKRKPPRKSAGSCATRTVQPRNARCTAVIQNGTGSSREDSSGGNSRRCVASRANSCRKTAK